MNYNKYYITQEEVNNTYYLVEEYLRKKETRSLSEFEKIDAREKTRVLICAKWLRDKAISLAPVVTNDLLDIESDIGTLMGLEHRIKSFDKLANKIVSDSVDFSGVYEKSCKHINDYLRYTFVIPDEEYIEKIDLCLHRLEEIGYVVAEIKNKWNSEVYKGIHARIITKDNDNIVEIQFHTPLGYRIKEGDDPESERQSTRRLYKVMQDEDAPEWLKAKVNKLRKYLQTFIEIPVGAIDYKYNRDIRRMK